MTSRGRGALIAAAACAIGLGRSVEAGVALTSEFSEPGKSPRQATSLVDGDRLRVESGGSGVVIFRTDRETVWILQPDRHSYVEMDKSTMAQVRRKAEAALAEMRAQLDKLPPDQRAQVEKMMKEHGMDDQGAAPEKPLTVKPTGRNDTVSGRSCHELDVYRGDTKESEVCVADWATAGVTKDDLAVFRKVGEMQGEMVRGIPGAKAGAGATEDSMKLFASFDGVPVRVRSLHDGKVTSEIRVTNIEKKDLDASLFEVPAGYRKDTPLVGKE